MTDKLLLTAEERHEGFMALSTQMNYVMAELRSNPEALEAVLTGRRGLLVRGGDAAGIYILEDLDETLEEDPR